METDPNRIPRCSWPGNDPLSVEYHDREWGYPVHNESKLFEALTLEGGQAGLSWLTILRKREGYRSAFLGFDPEQVARLNDSSVAGLLQNPAIVRHRGKIEATINNARRSIDLADEYGSLAAFFWSFEPHEPSHGLPSETAESRAMAKELKGRGFRFVGPTTAYAFMQAMGIVNDHLDGCAAGAEADRARAAFPRPSLRTLGSGLHDG